MPKADWTIQVPRQRSAQIFRSQLEVNLALMHIILDDDFCTYLALATDSVLPRLGPLADGKTLPRLGVLLLQHGTCPLEGPVEDLTVVGPRFQACGWSSRQMFYLPSVVARLPMCKSPFLRLELWAHKLAAFAEWVALVVAHDPRTSPTAASASFEAQSTAMVQGMSMARPESTACSAMNIYGGFTNDAKNEDWHISWFEQDVLTISSSSTSG